MNRIVVDASALLAVLNQEAGAGKPSALLPSMPGSPVTCWDKLVHMACR